MKTSINTNALWLALLHSAPACGDNGLSVEEDTDTSGPARTLSIPEQFELCNYSPTRASTAFQDSPLFTYRAILRFDAGTTPLPNDNVTTDVWLPITLQTNQGGQGLRLAQGPGILRVEADKVPHSPYPLGDVPGWDTLVYTDNAEAVYGERVDLRLAYPTGTDDFTLAPLLELDEGRRLIVNSFVPPVTAGAPALRTGAAPCPRPDANVDSLDLTFAEGVASSHTTPALWGLFGGYTTYAEGELDGITFAVENYWDLEYASADMGTNRYGVYPTLAARFPAQPDGACILIVELDVQSLENKYLARILDCDQNKLRDLTVESIDAVAI